MKSLATIYLLSASRKRKTTFTLIDFEPDTSAFTEEKILSSWELLLQETDYFNRF